MEILAESPGLFCAGACSGSGVNAGVNGEEDPIGEILALARRSTNTVVRFWTLPAWTDWVGGVVLALREIWNLRACCFSDRGVVGAVFCGTVCKTLFAGEHAFGWPASMYSFVLEPRAPASCV